MERIYCIISSPANVKRFSRQLLEGHCQPQKFIGWTQPIFSLTLFTSGLFCVKFPGNGGGFNHFKYVENHKSYVNEFLHAYHPRCQVLIWECKASAGFGIIEIHNTLAFKHFLLSIYSQNGLHSKIKCVKLLFFRSCYFGRLI